ncbi:MAG: M20/M25/M40 family metallo-hydrolase [Gammaproteobacteria bacterium]|nr:M20/M25/M40 family metallo-hydrolase [Gammaproteobacteria bacterium]
MSALSRRLKAATVFVVASAAATVAALGPETGFAAEADARAVTQAAKALRDRALVSEESYRLLEDLTTEVGPRFAGTAGDRAGVEWSKKTLESLGFTNIRTPEVLVPRWIRGEASADVLSPSPQQFVTLAIGGSIGTSDEGLVAPIVMVEDIDALRALPEGAVKGKIVYFNERMMRTQDGSGYAKAVAKRTVGPSIAASLGAVGVVIRSVGTSTNRIAHTGTLSYNVSAPRIPAVAISNPDANNLERIVQRSQAHSHDSAEPSNSDKPSDSGDVVMRLRVTARDLPQVRSANVIGEIPGTDLADEIVLIGGHLDSWDPAVGAQDDGAGVAIAIAAAKLAAEMTPKPRRTIRVVLFANEEFGLSGAAAYPADEGDENVDRHAFAMEADLGDGPVWKLAANVPERHWPLVKSIHNIVKDLGVALGENTARGGADIGPLRQRGVPVIAPALDATTYFDVHHTVNDTLEQVNPEHLKQSTAVFAVATYLAAMAEGPIERLPIDPKAR